MSLETWELRSAPGYEVSEDLAKIPEDRWREIVAAISSLKTDPYLGKPLVYQPLMGGDLSDCRSLPLVDLRIVYRLHTVTPPEVEILAVGKRRGSSVYKLALERLGRRKKRILRRPPFGGLSGR